MKKILFFAVALVALCACNGNSTDCAATCCDSCDTVDTVVVDSVDSVDSVVVDTVK